jgi:hypothetical protein
VAIIGDFYVRDVAAPFVGLSYFMQGFCWQTSYVAAYRRELGAYGGPGDDHAFEAIWPIWTAVVVLPAILRFRGWLRWVLITLPLIAAIVYTILIWTLPSLDLWPSREPWVRY